MSCVNVFLITFQAVAALLGIGLLGFWIIGRRNIPANAISLLTSIAIDITLPCLALGNLITKFSPQDYPDWWRLPLWFLGFEAAAFLLSAVSSFLVKHEIRGEFRISLFLQNGIFFPLIIIAGLFPEQAPVYLVMLFLFTMLHPSISFSVYPYFFGRRPDFQPAKFNLVRVLNPVLIATLVGIILSLLNINRYVPDFVVMILTMIGAMAIPLFMLILGGNVYNDFKQNQNSGRRFYWKEVLFFVAVKNFLFPAVFLVFLVLFKPDYPLAFIIILQAAVPPITAIPVFAERCGANRMLTNQLIVASFVASIVTIPLAIMAFSRYFPFPG